MDLELRSIVKRLKEGQCPRCLNRLSYITNDYHIGKLEDNGMIAMDIATIDRHYVYCDICGYSSKAIEIGIRLIPIDRIDKNDIEWDNKYLESNILINSKQGENPFKLL